MKVFTEAEVRSAARLTAEWQSPESFVLVPDKLPDIDSFLPAYIAQIPPELHRGHFGLLTSGSTGQPKLILGNKQRTEALARVIHEHQRGEQVETAILLLPIAYSFAFVNQVVWSVVMQRKLVITGGLTRPDEMIAALSEHPNSMLCMVSAQIPLLVSMIGDRTFPNVIRLHFAGGRFPQSDLPGLRQLFPNAAIFNNYGCAEAMPRLTIRPAEECDEPAVVGRPLPGIEMRAGVATSGDGQPIEFRSIYRAIGIVEASGYRPIADDDWIPSGDLGEQLPDGRWRLLGRSNEVFKRFGEKISLPVLLRQVRQVWPHEAAFYTETDKYSEMAHVLVIAPHPSEDDIKALLQHLRKSYGRPHWPVRIESLPALPLSANNKIDVVALAANGEKKVQWTLRY